MGQVQGPESHDQGQGQRLTHCHPPLKTRTQQSVHVQHAKQNVTEKVSKQTLIKTREGEVNSTTRDRSKNHKN